MSLTKTLDTFLTWFAWSVPKSAFVQRREHLPLTVERLEDRCLLSGDCLPPPAGLTDWWPGDGDTRDIIGHHDAALVNQATFAPGLAAQAFALNGSGAFVSVANDPALNVGT